jgi:hypothetical protein
MILRFHRSKKHYKSKGEIRTNDKAKELAGFHPPPVGRFCRTPENQELCPGLQYGDTAPIIAVFRLELFSRKPSCVDDACRMPVGEEPKTDVTGKRKKF